MLGTLTLNAGWHDRKGCPVKTTVSLPDDVDLTKLVLWNLSDGKAVPLQAWRTDDGDVELAWILDGLEAEETVAYEIRESDAGSAALVDGVELEESAPGKLRINVGGTHFTTYNYGADVVRPYLYPVMAEPGVGVTRNWPMIDGVAGETNDHPHHKGIYTAQDQINGVNNWGENEGHGWIIQKEFTRLYSGPVAGGFTAELEWTDVDKVANMTETRRITFYNTPTGERVFDWDVTLHASEGEVTIGDTKEGGLLTARVASSMDAGNENGGWIENGVGGKQEPETWGKRAPWCDYSGPVGEGWYGIALMDHPDNPRHPTFWHVRNYGLMGANCFGHSDFVGNPEDRWDFVIPAGESVTWKYRGLIHKGDASTGDVGLHYHAFASPPEVSFKAPRRR
jgi:hypothetical protein